MYKQQAIELNLWVWSCVAWLSLGYPFAVGMDKGHRLCNSVVLCSFL